MGEEDEDAVSAHRQQRASKITAAAKSALELAAMETRFKKFQTAVSTHEPNATSSPVQTFRFLLIKPPQI